MSLRKKLIRLAYEKPALRADLLPLVKQATDWELTWLGGFSGAWDTPRGMRALDSLERAFERAYKAWATQNDVTKPLTHQDLYKLMWWVKQVVYSRRKVRVPGGFVGDSDLDRSLATYLVKSKDIKRKYNHFMEVVADAAGEGIWGNYQELGIPEHMLFASTKAAWGKVPHPSEDMEGYVDHLVRSFLLPYPAIWNSLGLDRQDVRVKGRVVGHKGLITIVAPRQDTDLDIEIDTDGDHEVSGEISGNRVRKSFRFRAPVGGIHRGTQGTISSWIEDNLPVERVEYMVVTTRGAETFHSEEDLLRKYKMTGRHRGMSTRKELQGMPILKGMVGPMYDGRTGNVPRIRYEDGPTYEQMSR